jgi:hypothetical protein
MPQVFEESVSFCKSLCTAISLYNAELYCRSCIIQDQEANTFKPPSPANIRGCAIPPKATDSAKPAVTDREHVHTKAPGDSDQPPTNATVIEQQHGKALAEGGPDGKLTNDSLWQGEAIATFKSLFTFGKTGKGPFVIFDDDIRMMNRPLDNNASWDIVAVDNETMPG